jgi:hypothetical protein
VTIRSTPTLTTCDICNARMAAVRGPFSRNIGRPKPPIGHRLGYIVEIADREFPICQVCLTEVLQPA